jgi:hypothetical protein
VWSFTNVVLLNEDTVNSHLIRKQVKMANENDREKDAQFCYRPIPTPGGKPSCQSTGFSKGAVSE